MAVHALEDDLERLNIQDEEEDDQLDLNTVNQEQLIEHCGLTKLMAKRIIERRNILTKFTTINDLLSIPGISTGKFNILRTQSVVHEPLPPSGLPTHAQKISFLHQNGDHICQNVSTSEFSNISNSLCSKQGFIILHVNAASSLTGLDELQELVRTPSSQHLPDIVCVSDIRNYQYNLLEYRLYSFTNQHYKARGKGVAIYLNCRSIFYAQHRHDLALHIDECDNLWLEINYLFYPSFVIGVIYRNPRSEKLKNQNFQTELQKTISKIKRENKIFYIVGDINLDMLEQTNQMFEYCQMLAREGCRLLITRVTREVKHQKLAVLDHIYTKSTLESVTSGVIKTHDISDHYPVYCLIDYTDHTWQDKQNKFSEKKISESLLQPTTNQALKDSGLSFNPLSAIDTHPKSFFRFFLETKQLSFLNHCLNNALQSKGFQYQTKISMLDKRYEKTAVTVVGYRILNHDVGSVFKGAKQSYIIPVYVVSSFVGSIYDISQTSMVTGCTVGNTVGITFDDDSGWTFVPTFCVVNHPLAICHWPSPIYSVPI